MTAPKVKIGQTVRYHNGTASNDNSDGSDQFYSAAIVTMTRTEWQPGYRSPDGTWTPTNVVQPKAGTVHLHVFWPVVTDVTDAVRATWPTDYQHVPYGQAHACWSEVSA